MSTKRQKRITKQVRINAKWHKFLKLEAIENETTISKLLDEMCSYYFKGKIMTKKKEHE